MNSLWLLQVERDGDYEISLRRWPIEADAAIPAGLPAHKTVDGQYPRGVALPIAQARLKVASFDKGRAVGRLDKEVRFTVPLKAGRAQLQTWFSDAQGKEICGAYYVYVFRK